MRHEHWKELVFLAHDGELPPEKRADAAKHLASCAECRAELESWKKTSAALFRAPRPEPADRFVQDVMRRVSAEPDPAANPLAALLDRLRDSLVLRRLVLAGVAAAAVVVWVGRPAPRRPVPYNGGVEYAAAVVDESLAAEADENELGTSIEQYFL
jgi:anti-sigma factor RsiW